MVSEQTMTFLEDQKKGTLAMRAERFAWSVTVTQKEVKIKIKVHYKLYLLDDIRKEWIP